jgi:hypothetical protein
MNKTYQNQLMQDYAGFAPRREQTERAVSRFLYYLVKAQQGSFMTEPRVPHETGNLVSPAFFCARFTDAKGALRRYNYKLEGIVPGYNWTQVIARPYIDGNVFIENRMVKEMLTDTVLPANPVLANAPKDDKLYVNVDGKLVAVDDPRPKKAKEPLPDLTEALKKYRDERPI